MLSSGHSGNILLWVLLEITDTGAPVSELHHKLFVVYRHRHNNRCLYLSSNSKHRTTEPSFVLASLVNRRSLFVVDIVNRLIAISVILLSLGVCGRCKSSARLIHTKNWSCAVPDLQFLRIRFGCLDALCELDCFL